MYRRPDESKNRLGGCAYTVLQTVQRPGVHSVVYGTMHYKSPWSQLIRVDYSSDFGLRSVAILP